MLMMAFHRTPSLTKERYEEVIRRLTGKEPPLTSLGDLPFSGILFHATGQTSEGFCVVDIFESEEAIDRFRAAIGTIPLEVGIEVPPEFYPAHTYTPR
jgi:hypothetical protein